MRTRFVAFQASERSGVLGVKLLENLLLLSEKAGVFASGMLDLDSFLKFDISR